MSEKTLPLTARPAWKALEAHWDALSGRHLREFFAGDGERGERMAAEAAGLYLDYSKQRVTGESLTLLIALANDCSLRGRIDAMFRGDKINVSENRAALHTALRAPAGSSIMLDGVNVVPQVQAVLERMEEFSRRIRSGDWT